MYCTHVSTCLQVAGAGCCYRNVARQPPWNPPVTPGFRGSMSYLTLPNLIDPFYPVLLPNTEEYSRFLFLMENVVLKNTNLPIRSHRLDCKSNITSGSLNCALL